MAHLLTLPLELRELIYTYLFKSSTIRRGFYPRPKKSPTSSSLIALLLTCHQIYTEAWRHLPLNATLHFRDTETMLDVLMSVDQAVITRLRRIVVKAHPLPLYIDSRPDYYPTYYFHNALSLLPGLCLERLEIRDAFHEFGMGDGWRDVVTYFDVEGLLKSDAWKELVYVTPCTDFIASGYDHRKKRVAQPENWNEMIKERDGRDTGAEVKMFITLDQDKRRELQEWNAKPGHEVIQNPRSAEPQQDWKGEVTIVARRGRRASAVQLGISEKKTWKELKEAKGGLLRDDWTPYYNDMADAVSWIYGGYHRRMQMAHYALGK